MIHDARTHVYKKTNFNIILTPMSNPLNDIGADRNKTVRIYLIPVRVTRPAHFKLLDSKALNYLDEKYKLLNQP